jgi:hypothetical protein
MLGAEEKSGPDRLRPYSRAVLEPPDLSRGFSWNRISNSAEHPRKSRARSCSLHEAPGVPQNSRRVRRGRAGLLPGGALPRSPPRRCAPRHARSRRTTLQAARLRRAAPGRRDARPRLPSARPRKRFLTPRAAQRRALLLPTTVPGVSHAAALALKALSRT